MFEPVPHPAIYSNWWKCSYDICNFPSGHMPYDRGIAYGPARLSTAGDVFSPGRSQPLPAATGRSGPIGSANRLGRRSVLRWQLCNEAQPELAFRYAPLVGGISSARRKRRTRTSTELPSRPLCLLPQPVALSVLSAAPGGRLFQFRLGGRRHEVAKGWGPERIETGWWRGRPIWRDYYRVETTGGRRFWLFRTAIDRRWFLHGMFE